MQYLIPILITTYKKAFILGPQVPCRVSFHSITSDPGVHGLGVGLEVKIQNISKVQYLIHTLITTCQKAFISHIAAYMVQWKNDHDQFIGFSLNMIFFPLKISGGGVYCMSQRFYLNFRQIKAKISGIPKFRIFTVLIGVIPLVLPVRSTK